MKIYFKSLILLFLFGADLSAMDNSELARYALEYRAALIGQNWYDGAYVPTAEEVHYAHLAEPPLAHIKIRLPIDLKRIFDEYRQRGKPISLAVSCGDRELPWRANFAALHKDSSRPEIGDYWDNLPDMLPLNYNANSENFISIDPFLGIRSSILEGAYEGNTGRGAGHLVMDANNVEHWQQLAKFFADNNIKIHQIIFTGCASPASTFEFKPEFFATQLSMLEPQGKLVEPYFMSGIGIDEYFRSWRHWFHPKGNGTKLFLGSSFLGDEMALGDLFYDPGKFMYDGQAFSTTSLHLINLVFQLCHGDDISENLSLLIEEKYPTASFNFKQLIYNLSRYYLSIFNLGVFSENLSGNTEFLLDSQRKQMETIIPFLKEYYAGHGLRAQFITSATQALMLNNLDIEGQNWQSGDYPYGERGNIALILSKIDPRNL